MQRKYSLLTPLILFVLLFASASHLVQAQTRAHIKLGVAGSTLRGDTDTDFSSITRFAGGGGISFQLRYGLRVQAEVLYINKGAQADGEIELEGIDDVVPIEATFDLTYIEVPLLLVYQFNSRGIRPVVFAGPSIAKRLDAIVRFRATAGGPEFSETDDSVEETELGLTLGGGIEFDVGSETLSLGVRTSLGLSNARTAKPALHNTSLGIFAGIIF